MRILLSLLACIILTGSAFAQNAFSIIKAGKTATRVPKSFSAAVRPIVISRTIIVPRAQTKIAREICSQRSKYIKIRSFKQHVDKISLPKTYIETRFAIARLEKPEKYYGGYNYLRTLFKLSRDPQNIELPYTANWQKVSNTATYHGVHHIVNKSTLKEIYADMQAKAAERALPFPINLTEMQNNAPAIFHRLHGDPAFAQLFHNTNRQLGLYYTGGVKMIIEDFFIQLDQTSLRQNNPELKVPEEAKKGTMKEAELWCKIFHLRWD